MGESSRVGDGAGETVAGIGEGRAVDVGKNEAAGVGGLVVGWQAVRRRRHPRRSFFILVVLYNTNR